MNFERFRLPDLPDIANDNLRERIFTHKSVQGLPTNMANDVEEPLNYERLAQLGSHALALLIGWKAYEERPFHRPGPLTDSVKKRLEGKQLAKYCDLYGLIDKVFQAYVGAVFLEDKLNGLVEWLWPLIDYVEGIDTDPSVPNETDPSTLSTSEPPPSYHTDQRRDDVPELAEALRGLSPSSSSGSSSYGAATPRHGNSNASRDHIQPPIATRGGAGNQGVISGPLAICKLNELHQRGSISAPELRNESVETTSATLWVVVGVCEGTEFRSDRYRTAKEAKADAATKILAFLRQRGIE